MILAARLACMFLLATCSSGAAALPADVDSKLGQRIDAAEAPIDVGSEKHFISARAAANRYQSGLALVMRSVADARISGRALSHRLAFLHDEIHPQLGWGEIRADNVMLAITPGRRDVPRGMAVAPDHPRLAVPGPTLQTGFDGDLLIIAIRPDAMSQRWAGIFMVHELSHLADHRAAIEGIGCSAEHEAYRVEREAMNLLSNDRFDEALDIALVGEGLRTANEIQAMLANGAHDSLAAAISTIERLMEESPALSPAEREMRDGFYAMSLIERLGERAGEALQARCLESERLLRSASKY